MNCLYLPLLLCEQEKLREASRISPFQGAGLPYLSNRQAAVVSVQSHDPGPRIEEVAPDEPQNPVVMDKEPASTCPAEVMTTHSAVQVDRAARIGSPCAILSPLPLVKAVIQDVMAGRFTRTQGEEPAELGKDHRAKVPRTGGFFQRENMEAEE